MLNRISIKKLADHLNIGSSSVHTIIHDHLKMRVDITLGAETAYGRAKSVQSQHIVKVSSAVSRPWRSFPGPHRDKCTFPTRPTWHPVTTGCSQT